MFSMGGVDVKNPNALIAMAFVSQNADNPYVVFCEYIKYCISKNPSDTMTLKEIRASINDEFGLNLPYNVILKCLEIVSKQGMIELKGQRGRLIKRIKFFDEDSFNNKKMEYKRTETEVINALINYTKKYGKDWKYEYAREQLIKILDRNGLAYDIFVHTRTSRTENGEATSKAEDILQDEEIVDIEDVENQPFFSDDFYVGKFIQKTLREDAVQKDYLHQICEGLMLCVGAYQIPSANAEITAPQINGTTFYFDTRLLLRFIGCAGEAAVTATRELIQLIQNAHGNICYFPHTLDEMISAFDKAIRELENGYAPHDNEMRIYASEIGNNITILKAKKSSLKTELEKSNIYIRQLGVYSDSDKLQFGFNLEDLQQYMCKSLSWERQAIINDAQSIWEVHMQRNGRYEEYCGTQNRLPVFVTSNSRLIGLTLEYKNDRPNVRGISSWKANRLPVITDIRLTCRLWSPAEQGERLSMLYLVSNSVAAQRPTKRFLNKIREYAIELEKNIPEYATIPLPAFFDDNITDAIFENTQGLEDNLNIGLFANTLNELIEWKSKEQEEAMRKISDERDEVVNELNTLSNQYNHQNKDIIEGAIQQCEKLLKKYNLLLQSAICWPVIVAVAFAGFSIAVSDVSNGLSFICSIVLGMVVAAIEEFVSSHFITKRILNKVLPYVIDKYYKDADKFLRKVEMPYKDEIIKEYCDRNKLFSKCKKICENKEQSST